MLLIVKVIWESIRQAFQQLLGNKLRTFLSLLGITIGIWCVISVMSAVDSLEYSVKESFEQLGEDVIYVDKYDWGPKTEEEFLRQRRRPRPDFADYRAIEDNVGTAEIATYSVFFSSKLIEWRSNNINGTFAIGATKDYAEIFNLKFEKGRYFNNTEYTNGLPRVILGHSVAEGLFGGIDPIGKTVKAVGRKMQVIGVLEKQGETLFTPIPFDQCVIVSYPYAIRITNAKTNKYMGRSINVKARNGISLENLKDDIYGVLRARRKLKPKEKNNFALNSLSIINNALSSVFSQLSTASWIIGGFAMLVGMFSVANIMFVSVKERTNLIGIKKAIGAKKYIILLEFLIESVILCIIGGALGLLFVYLAAKAATSIFGYTIFLSFKNILVGVGVSILTGLISGIIPASQAANMDPVEAMRA